MERQKVTRPNGKWLEIILQIVETKGKHDELVKLESWGTFWETVWIAYRYISAFTNSMIYNFDFFFPLETVLDLE